MSKKRKIVVSILIAFLFILLIRSFNRPKLVSPIVSFPKVTSLNRVVEKAMTDSKGRYGIIVKNFKTGETYSMNEHQNFEPGSLYKLWVMASVYQKIKDGSLKEDDLLSEDVVVLNDLFNIDPEDAELQDGHIELTVLDALNQMVTISHNYAALLLAEKIKNSTITKFLKKNGFNESEIGEPPKTTPGDVALFFDKLYKGEIIDKEYSQKMLALLGNQQLNDGLPKYLPAQTKIAHKTGDIGWNKHDVGIIFSEKGDYLIVILSESDSPPGAQERIAQLSKAVWDYFNNRFAKTPDF